MLAAQHMQSGQGEDHGLQVLGLPGPLVGLSVSTRTYRAAESH